MIILDQKTSDVRRAGAIQYTVYTGSREVGEAFKQFSGTAKSINMLLTPTREGRDEVNNNGQAVQDKETVEGSTVDGPKEFGDDLIKYDTEEDEADGETRGQAAGNECREEEFPRSGRIVGGLEEFEDGLIETSMSDTEDDLRKSVFMNSSRNDDEQYRRGGMTNDSEEENVENTGMEEDFFLDEDGKLDDQPRSNVDLRLRTFQDMGRLCKLFPGAYFDHDKCAWLCRKCQAFSFPCTATNPWISSGVNLGDHPIRKLEKHFNSNIHLKSLKTEQLLNKPSVFEMLKKHSNETQSKNDTNNRSVLKIMFTAAYICKYV